MAAVTLGFYDESRSRGGTTRYLLDLLSCLDRDRYRPVFFGMRSYEWHDDLRKLDIPIQVARPSNAIASEGSAPPTSSRIGEAASRLPRRLNWALGTAKDIRCLTRFWKEHPVDLLHINICGTEPAPIAARLAGQRRIVGVYHISPSYDLDGKRRGQPYRGVDLWALRSLHAAIACSRFTQRDWEAHYPVPKGRMTTVQNGIDLSRGERHRDREEAKRSLGFYPEDLLIGCVANLHPYKGHTHLIKAFRKVKSSHPNARLLLAGTGALELQLRAEAEDLRDVYFLNYCEDVRSVLEALDVYVQPSVMEALGLAVLEAAAMGLPVVASDVGGLPEVVRSEETGVLVHPADPDALARALNALLNDRARRERLGSAGADMVSRRFTRTRMAAETFAVYERLLSSRTKAATSRPRVAL